MTEKSQKKFYPQWDTISIREANYTPPLSKSMIDNLPIDSLALVEIIDDTLYFLFFEGTKQTFRGTLSTALQLLSPYGFAQYHRSYLANPRYACFENGMLFVAENPPNINFRSSPIGKEYLPNIQNQFLSKDEFLMKTLNKIVRANLSRLS